MKCFNIYYKDMKINNRPLSDDDIKSLKESKYIYKRNNITNKLESIPVNKIQIIKTILI